MDTFEISIKSDEDGFILLQCSLCGEFFKILASDWNDESTINIWCPYCGLIGENYFTDEVIEIAMRIAENEANRILYNEFKKLERQTKNNKYMSFKSGNKPIDEIITPIKQRVDNLETKKYKCCNSEAKIRPVAIASGSYCPLCGGADFE